MLYNAIGGDTMIKWENYDEQLIFALEKYVPDYQTKDEAYMLALIDDMEKAKEKHQLSYFYEYFEYQFYGMSEEDRDTYCGSELYANTLRKTMPDLHGGHTVFRSKQDIYNTFKDYYHRDVIEVKGFEDFAKFADFVSRNKTFIVKENEGSLGSNISKITITENTPIKSAFFRVLQYGGCVCETWIEQCDEMAKFNSSSINTIRYASFYDDDKLHYVYAMFRTGRNGEVVDNASMGGVAAAVDMKTGVVISDGYTKGLEHFECHPDTGVKYKGFHIPRWEEIEPMVIEMHKLYPISKLVGWDLALTDDGWVLIEGNGKPNIDTIQLIYGNTFGHGLKEQIMSAIGKYNEE